MITTWEAPVPRMDTRKIGFIYVDEASLSQRDGAFLVIDRNGQYEVPVATISALLLGPGVTITSKVVELAASMDVTILWVGQEGVRFYASGKSNRHRSTLLEAQAKLVSNVQTRAAVARQMYQMRFGQEEDVSGLTIQKLRGKEGMRIRNLYVETAKKYGIEWKRRSAQVEEGNDIVNLALTMATQCLYGLTHAIIEGIGASPALGFIHTGNTRSFVFDIADLYKFEIALPLAFEMASENVQNVELESRMRMREIMHREKLPKRIVEDIKTLILGNRELEIPDTDEVFLWDDKLGEIRSQ